jgi:hypothetical protein
MDPTGQAKVVVIVVVVVVGPAVSVSPHPCSVNAASAGRAKYANVRLSQDAMITADQFTVTL